MKLSTLVIISVLLTPASVSIAEEQVSWLPQPLDLESALSIAVEGSNPAVRLAEARNAAASAQLLNVEADDDLTVKASAHLLAVEPSDLSVNRTNNDSRAILSARKKLYDFGRSDALEDAARKRIGASHKLMKNDLGQHQLQVARYFFDVLLADQENVLTHEEMTLAFLAWDKAKDRHELGKLSDLELLELENKYRIKLQRRKISEQKQKLSRRQLALALNRPNDPPSKLVSPDVNWQAELPTLDNVIEKALAGNARLKALQQHVDAAGQKLQAARLNNRPVLHGEMTIADYHRETGSTHQATAGLLLEIPLYTGGRTNAAVSIAQAERDQALAELQLAQLRLREEASSLLLTLDTLKADLLALQVSESYGEIYLDKNRALYELEVASDFGDAIVRVSEVALKKMQSELDYAYTRMALAVLQGESLGKFSEPINTGK